MAYSSAVNQAFHFSRYIITFMLLFYIWPRYLFKQGRKSPIEGFFSNYIRMAFLVIAVSYFLVFVKLFEVFSVVGILTLLTLRCYFARNSITSWKDFMDELNVKFYKVTDGIIHPVHMLDRLRNSVSSFLLGFLKNHFSSISSSLSFLLLFMVFLYSAYIRFFDAFNHAAPALSDSYMTLAWAKYVDSRLLFYEGVYPYGFHIYLDILNKFSAIDPIYVLKYTCPLNSMLIIAGIYFAVSRFSKRQGPAIAASIVYGLVGNLLLQGDWDRQAAGGSKEFSFIFVLPTIYFLYSYVSDREKNKDDFHTALAGIVVTGLSYPVSLAHIFAGIMSALPAAFVSGSRRSVRAIAKTLSAWVVCSVVSFVPMLAGLAFGKRLHESFAQLDSITAAGGVYKPTLLDSAALAGALAIMLYAACIRIKEKRCVFSCNYVLALATFGAILYAVAAAFPVRALAVISNDFRSLAIPFIIGAGLSAFGQILPVISKRKIIEVFLCFCLFRFITVNAKPVPIIPYKTQYDAAIEQYLRINRLLRPKSYWIVSTTKELFAVVLGKGFHVNADEFVEKYDPQGALLSERGKSMPDGAVPSNVFIYCEKKIFKVDKENAIYTKEEQYYQKREKDEPKLKSWVEKYMETHQNAEVFFEDENLLIIRIVLPADRNEIFRRIWES